MKTFLQITISLVLGLLIGGVSALFLAPSKATKNFKKLAKKRNKAIQSKLNKWKKAQMSAFDYDFRTFPPKKRQPKNLRERILSLVK